MDGLHKLIEMLEKRFGKFWADVLLLITVVGAAAWGINALFAYLIRPAIGLGADVLTALRGGHINRTDAIITAVEIALYIFFAIALNVYLQFARKRAEAKIRKNADELASIIKESKAYVHEREAELNTFTDAKQTELLALLDEAKKRHDQMDADSDRRGREHIELLKHSTDEAVDAISNLFANTRDFIERARKAGIEPPPELIFQEDESSSPQLPLDTEQKRPQ